MPTQTDRPSDRLRAAIRDTVSPGCLGISTIADRLNDRWSKRQVRAAVDAMVASGTLKEHPVADRLYRVDDESDPDRLDTVRDLTTPERRVADDG